MRVVLLARSAGEWWRQLIDNAEYRVAQLLVAVEPIYLKPLTTMEGRREVYNEAIVAFARRLGTSLPGTNLTLADADTVFLVVHAAALTAVLDHDSGNGRTEPRTANDVLTGLLRHEAGYWHKTAIARGLILDHSVERIVVASACLIGASDEERAVRMLSHIPDLAGSPEQCGRVARWLNDLYPGKRDEADSASEDWIAPLRPDRVAEYLIAEELHSRPQILKDLFDGLSDRRTLRALTILANAAVNDNRATGMLRGLFQSDVIRFAVPAVKVTIEANPAVAALLNQILRSGPIHLSFSIVSLMRFRIRRSHSLIQP